MSETINGFVESQGVKIHYIGKNLNNTVLPSLLFVPGLMMPGWIFEKQLDYFAEKFRVVAMDPRSQGDSEQTSEGHYASSLAKDINTVVDKLNLDNLVLIGWSLGVPEVINYAIQFGKLKGLVLVDGLTGIDPSLPFYKSTIDYWTQLQTDRILKTTEFVKSIFKQPQSKAYLEKLTASALRTPTNTVMTLIENYLLQDFRPLLPRINVDTLIITIEGPRLGYMQDMQKMIPHSRLVIIKDAAHALFVDQPEQFNHWIRRVYKGTKQCPKTLNCR